MSTENWVTSILLVISLSLVISIVIDILSGRIKLWGSKDDRTS